MKQLQQTVVLLLFSISLFAQAPSNTVNPIIQDESFVQLFGTMPDQYTNDKLRVQAHLSYVEYQLRQQTVTGLSQQQMEKRTSVLDLLHEYWMNGVFPDNFDYPTERKPCFIDKNGTICAVGYLIEKTAGIEVAREINAEHQYDYLLDMNEPVIEAWAEEHGFTLEECAMIQPTYGPVTPPLTVQKPISRDYGISSGFMGGFNIAINTVNLSGRFSNSKAIPIIGLLTGASQILMGISNVRRDFNEFNINGTGRVNSYKAQNNLSYINIAVGTTTLITSALNLYVNRKPRKSAVGVYSYPGLNNEMNMGLTFARRL